MALGTSKKKSNLTGKERKKNFKMIFMDKLDNTKLYKGKQTNK